MARVSGKVALVTGAGRGQGEAEAFLLAKEGAKVIATDIDFDNVKTVVAKINAEFKNSAIALRHDVASKDDWVKVVEEGVKKFGPITILVNNAGILAPCTYDLLTHELWQKVMDVNAWSQFVGIQTVVPYMKKAGGGSIINSASLSAINACGRFSVYTASKGAVDAFSRAAAIELAEFNIRVNCLVQGVIHTPMLDEVWPTKESTAEALAAQPLGRFGSAIDVAYLVVYLASDESCFTTGSSQVIDGGLSVQGGVRPVLER